VKKIIFFNHYHKGDMHTHKEFIRHIKNELKDFKFEYYTSNPQKLINELDIQIVGSPNTFEKSKPLYKNRSVLVINTWVGCFWDIFCKHGGINMHTLYEQWGKLFNAINKTFDTSLTLKPNKEDYLPKINYSLLNTKNVDTFLEGRDGRFKVLVCNNEPHSGQSFVSNMEEFINPLAKEYTNIDFICTDKINTNLANVFFTNNITQYADDCDLLEISYLSSKMNVIVGKNSGPFVFCETYDNYMDPNKTFISFNKKHPDYSNIQETMSNGLNIKCNYKAVPINDIYVLSQLDTDLIFKTIKEALPNEKT
jgi:hypothetical protein